MASQKLDQGRASKKKRKVETDDEDEDEDLNVERKSTSIVKEGTNVRGHYYETKLIALMLFRALTDTNIKEFYLTTNVGKIGAMNDVIMKYCKKGNSKPKILFIQGKHRDNPRRELVTNHAAKDENKRKPGTMKKKIGDFSARKYFNSYLIIKDRFNTDPNDDIFKDKYEDTDCDFILFTNSHEKFTNKRNLNRADKRNAFIFAKDGGTTFQLQYNEFAPILSKIPPITYTGIDNLVKDYLEKFVYYTNQPNEDGIGDEVLKEIRKYLKKYLNVSENLKIYAIYLHFYMDVQNWHKPSNNCDIENKCLTRNCKFFENARQEFLDKPLLSSLDFIHMNTAMIDDNDNKYIQCLKKLAVRVTLGRDKMGIFLSKKEMDEVNNILFDKDKNKKNVLITGVIEQFDHVEPRFINDNFAYYLCVQLIAEKLFSKRNIQSIWKFLLDDFFDEDFLNVRVHLDNKLKDDSELAALSSKSNNKIEIYNILVTKNYKPLYLAVREGLHNISIFLLKAVEFDKDRCNELIKYAIKEQKCFLCYLGGEFEIYKKFVQIFLKCANNAADLRSEFLPLYHCEHIPHYSPLFIAIHLSDSELIDTFLKQVRKQEDMFKILHIRHNNNFNSYGLTIVHELITEKCTEFVLPYLKNLSAELIVKTLTFPDYKHGATPMHYIALATNFDIIKFLINHELINGDQFIELLYKADHFRDTCLHYSAKYGGNAFFKFLHSILKKDVFEQVLCIKTESVLQTPAHYAAKALNFVFFESISTFVDEIFFEKLVSEKSRRGATPVHHISIIEEIMTITNEKEKCDQDLMSVFYILCIIYNVIGVKKFRKICFELDNNGYTAMDTFKIREIHYHMFNHELFEKKFIEILIIDDRNDKFDALIMFIEWIKCQPWPV